jgi:filamentous hemagglutinin family protein
MNIYRISILVTLSAFSTLSALPTGEEVKAGEATFCADSKSLVVTTSDKAIIEYQQFNIGKGETVQFIQPSKNSCVLNRVIGGNGSEILGQLQGNGRIFLVNPQGIYFGPDAVVNAGSFLATSLSIRDEDFLTDTFEFFLEKGGAGAIVNEGVIQVEGFAALFAPTVENRGSVYARVGKVFVGAAEKVTLDLMGDGLIQFRVDGELERALIENYGRIEAAGGDVLISLKAARRAIQSVMNTGGIEVAAEIEESDGVIRLVAASEIVARNVQIEGERVDARGSIDVSGADVGGRVEILGDRVELWGAKVDASGDRGGGTILIGGDYQGKGTCRNASRTSMDEFSEVRADAYTSGAGGKVILWSDDTTLFDGKIYARGGAGGGDGGFVETSGKENLGVGLGYVNTSAPKGKFGDWLMDPASITIATAGANGSIANGSAPNCATTGTLNIRTSTLAGAGSNVALCAQNGAASTITVNNAFTMAAGISISMTAGSGNAGTITLNAGITTQGQPISLTGVVVVATGAISLDTTNAGGSAAGSGITLSNTVNGAQALTLNGGTGGTVTMTGAVGGTTALTSITATGATITQSSTAKTTGAISYTGPTAINLGGDLTTAGGIVTMTGPVVLSSSSSIDSTNGGGVAAGAAINFTSTINGTVAGSQALTLNSGTAGAITFSGIVGGLTRPGAVLISSVAGTSSVSIGNNITANSFTITNALPTTLSGTSTINTSANNGAISFGGTINGTVAGSQALTLNAGSSGAITLTGVLGATTRLGAVLVSSAAGTSTLSIGGNITANSFTVTNAVPTTLAGTSTINTSANNGAISFGGAINGAQALTLTAGTGSISLGGAVGGGTRIGTLTITSAFNVTAAAITAGAIVQSAGTGTTTLNGAINTNGASGIALTGNVFNVNNNITTTGGGSLSITHSGTLTFAVGVVLSIDGTFTDSGGGSTVFSGAFNLTTNGTNITFSRPLFLTGTTTLSTGAGNGNIQFSSTVDGTQILALTAGGGNILFNGGVGQTTPLGAISIASTNNVTAVALNAASFNQAAGTGTTTFNGTVVLTGGAGFAFIGNNLTFNNTLTASSDGANIQVAGTLVLSSGATFTLAGAFVESGTGTAQITNSISTTSGGIQFGTAVSLAGTTVLNTSAAVGDIVFSSTLDGPGALTLTAGTNNISVVGAAGAVTRLGALQINSAANVTIGAGMKASSIIQGTAATGTTSFTGTVDASGSGGVQLLGGAITVNGSLITLIGPFTVTNTGTLNLTAGASTLLGGAFTQSGGGSVNLAGTLTTSGVAISFANPIAMSADTTISDGSGPGAITLSSTVQGAHNLTLSAIGANIVLGGALGTVGTPLSSLKINNAANVSTQAITAGTITQVTGTGTTTFNGALSTSGASGINLAGTGFTFNAPFAASGTGTVTISNAGLANIAAAGTSAGAFLISGAGSTQISSTITAGGSLKILNNLAVTGTSTLDTHVAGTNIELQGIVTGTGALTLAAGTGTISFSQNISSLGALTISSAALLTMQGITATSIAISGVTGATVFNSDLTTSGSSGISVNGAAISFLGNVTAGSTGPIAIVNSGALTTTPGKAFTTGSTFTQSGAGAVSLAGSIASSGTITFGTMGSPVAMTLIATTSMNSANTGSGATIAIWDTIDGNSPLTMTASAGDINLNADVGSITPIGAFTIVSDNNTTIGTMNALSVNVLSGTGTFFVGTIATPGSINTTGTAGITKTVNSVLRFGSLTTTNGGSVIITLTGGTLTGNAGNTTSISGSYTVNGTGLGNLAGTIGANVAISIPLPITLTANSILNSGSGGITLAAMNNNAMGPYTITLNAGGGGGIAFSHRRDDSGERHCDHQCGQYHNCRSERGFFHRDEFCGNSPFQRRSFHHE